MTATPIRRPPPRARHWTRRLALALVFIGAAGCADDGRSPGFSASLDSGIGGTGIQTGDGIGGTGVVADGERGIGGTGIVGTVTAFGSIIVNGRTVVVPESIDVDVAGRPATAADLRVGHLVEVEAAESPSGLQARRISVRQVLIGPIDSVDPVNAEVRALEQSIRVGDATVVVDDTGPRIGTVGSLVAGDWVAVSGLRSPEGDIAASRLEVIPPQDAVLLEGRVDQVSPNRFSVSGLAITGAATAAAPGRVVRVRARAAPDALVVLGVEPLAASPFDGRIDRLSIQAFPGTETGYGRLPPGTGLAGDIDETILVDASLDARGRLSIENVSPYRGPERDEDRDDRSEPALRGPASRAWDRPPDGWAGDDMDDDRDDDDPFEDDADEGAEEGADEGDRDDDDRDDRDDRDERDDRDDGDGDDSGDDDDGDGANDRDDDDRDDRDDDDDRDDRDDDDGDDGDDDDDGGDDDDDGGDDDDDDDRGDDDD